MKSTELERQEYLLGEQYRLYSQSPYARNAVLTAMRSELGTLKAEIAAAVQAENEQREQAQAQADKQRADELAQALGRMPKADRDRVAFLLDKLPLVQRTDPRNPLVAAYRAEIEMLGKLYGLQLSN